MAMGSVAAALGAYGIFAPYRWNLLRLKQRWARYLSPEANARVPKVVGAVLLAGGVVLLAMGALR